MRVKVISLIYGLKSFSTLVKNIQSETYYFDLDFVNAYGIGNAMNAGLRMSDGYDAVMFLAHDIEEPKDWLRLRVEAMEADNDVGIVSIPVDGKRNEPYYGHVIGNWLIRRELIDKIGGFNEDFFPYGPVDLDYCERAKIAGFKTMYVANVEALHPHPHGGDASPEKKKMTEVYFAVHTHDCVDYASGKKSIVKPL